MLEEDTDAPWMTPYHLCPIFKLSDELGTKLSGDFVSFGVNKKRAETTARIHMVALLREWGLNVRLDSPS